jgi:hypothetical protein
MGENKTKTKAAMLDELESIKGLLLEEDDIPILQEVIENKDTPEASPAPKSPTMQMPTTSPEHSPASSNSTSNANRAAANSTSKNTAENKATYEEQQDFFNSALAADDNENFHAETDKELMDTLGELEKHTADVAANKFSIDVNKISGRSSLAKATGENPFLPQHIRARLHGNNPPPLFENETAHKISTTSVPTRQLGNTFSSSSISFGNEKISNHHKDIVDSIVQKMMPELEKELRNRLEIMTKNLLDELNK